MSYIFDVMQFHFVFYGCDHCIMASRIIILSPKLHLIFSALQTLLSAINAMNVNANQRLLYAIASSLRLPVVIQWSLCFLIVSEDFFEIRCGNSDKVTQSALTHS